MMERWNRQGKMEMVSPPDCGQHCSEFTHSILSDGGLEADNYVVLVQHVHHNLVVKTFRICHFLASADAHSNNAKLATIWLH